MPTALIDPDYNDMLNKARAAQIALMSGNNVVRIKDQNGEEIQYSAKNTQKLAGWIAWLEMKCGVSGGGFPGPARVML